MSEFAQLRKELLHSAITSKAQRVLFKTGAYALTTMRRNIRPSKKKPAQYTVTVGNRVFIVPLVGKVLDAKTQRPVKIADANAARMELKKQLNPDGAGQSVRRGPTDLLRTASKFTVDLETYTVTSGPIVFSKQPALVGVTNVPELLEFGGKESLHKQLVQYEPHPFVAPALLTSEARMAQLIESEQLRP